MEPLELIGLKLDDARARLAAGLTGIPSVVTTAPPFDPKYRVPVWGELRVIRARELNGGAIELLVARELLAEELLAKPAGPKPGRGGQRKPPQAVDAE